MKKQDAIRKANTAMLNSGNEYLVIDNDNHTGYTVIKADDLDDWAPGAYIHYSTDDYNFKQTWTEPKPNTNGYTCWMAEQDY